MIRLASPAPPRSGLALAALAAPAAIAQQDMRRPEHPDRHVAAEACQDLRSPDARDPPRAAAPSTPPR